MRSGQGNIMTQSLTFLYTSVVLYLSYISSQVGAYTIVYVDDQRRANDILDLLLKAKEGLYYKLLVEGKRKCTERGRSDKNILVTQVC